MLYKNMIVKSLLSILLLSPLQAHQATTPADDPIMHHLKDDYAWHVTKDVTLYLPVLIYRKGNGWHVFSSKHLWDKHHKPVPYEGFILDHGKIKSVDGAKIYDISITKNVASMLISMLLLFLLFLGMASYYKRNQGGYPRGAWVVLAYLIDLVRNHIVKPNIDEKDRLRFTPYLLTLFFFIWLNNLMGLLPGAANVTGNLSVTFVLALFAFLITNLHGTSYYWSHIFNPPGVPKWILPIMVPIELLGIFTKPFTLMLRLFSNMLAGHLVLLNIIWLIFILKSILVPIISVSLGVFMLIIKLFVAFLQSYIFVFLLAKYLGTASHTKSVHTIDKKII